MHCQEGAGCDHQDDVAKAAVQGSIATPVLSKNLLLCNLHCNTRLKHLCKDRPRPRHQMTHPQVFHFGLVLSTNKQNIFNHHHVVPPFILNRDAVVHNVPGAENFACYRYKLVAKAKASEATHRAIKRSATNKPVDDDVQAKDCACKLWQPHSQ